MKQKSFVLLAGVAFLSAHLCFAGVIQLKQETTEQPKKDREWMFGETVLIARGHKDPLPEVLLEDGIPFDYFGSSPVSDDSSERSGPESESLFGSGPGKQLHDEPPEMLFQQD